jgi:phospholipid/cholesterol/gamma-HCH transport system substrate-binding protein
MLRQFGGGLAGYGPGLHQFVATAPTNLADISSISDNLTSAQTNLVGLMRSTDRLSGRFQNREEQITELLSRTDTTLRAIATDNSVPLSSTLAKLPTTLHAVRGAVDDIRQPLIDVGDATGHLRSGSVALGNATPDVRGVFQEAPDPLHLVPDVSDDAQPAVEDLTHTVSDARPFVSRLGDGLGSASEPLGVLAPYSLDIGTFFHDIGSLVSNHDGWQHRLRIMTGPPLAPSFLPQQIQDAHNAYPAPGRATLERDRSGGLIPGS